MSDSIVVIGSSNIDFIMKMDRLPEQDETVTNATFMQTFGGKGANQAVAAGRAGGNVTFVNCVGDDPYAEQMIAEFQNCGIRTDHIYRETGISSGTALVMIGQGGHNYLSVAPGANALLTPDRIDALSDQIAQAACILMQFEIPAPSIARALDIAQQKGVPVVWNYAPALPFDLKNLHKVDVLIANEPEASVLSGTPVSDVASAQGAAQKLRALGVQTAIITLGAAGSVVASQETPLGSHIPAFPVEPIDTTAAGDTYCGCLVVALAEGHPLPKAIRFASAAAALCVQRLGAQPSIPWRAEIEVLLQNQS